MPRHRRARPPRGRRIVDSIIHGVGELLITGGLVVALFLVWQLWWTSIDAQKKAQVHSAAFEQTQVESPRVEGTRHTEDPPPVDAVGYGGTIGMLVVPRWYGVTNNNMPILEGTGPDVLDQAAAGHYPDTQQLAEIGNFAIAGQSTKIGRASCRERV